MSERLRIISQKMGEVNQQFLEKNPEANLRSDQSEALLTALKLWVN